MDYKQQYLHPKWQKKRLEIMERDDFRCCQCKSEEKTLHVHHRYYHKTKKVWEYPNSALVLYCTDCHKSTHKSFYFTSQAQYVAHLILLNFWNPENIKQFTSYSAEFIELFSNGEECFDTLQEAVFNKWELDKYFALIEDE